MDVRYIFLSDNSLTGSLLPFLFNSHNLVFLSLSRNNFYGELPSNIGNASALMVLMLDGNNFSGNLPESITNNISRLVLLDLSNNNFSSNTLLDVSFNQKLQTVDFSSNEFSGEIPTNVTQVTRTLGKNKFSSNLTDMTTLEHLNTHDNKITSEFLDCVCPISNLYTLNLRNNSLYGSISNCISNVTSLQILDLSSNHLVGDILPKFGNLAGMIETPDILGFIIDNLNVGFYFENKLNDVIVNLNRSKYGLLWQNLDICSLLDLSMNQLSSEIPASLGSLKALKLLNVSHNKLYGRLPVSFGDLKNLESLDFVTQQSIGLNSTITSKLATINYFTGKILVSNQMDTMNDLNFYANNSGFYGMQIRVSCSKTLSPTKPPGVKNKETWFSWEGVEIGYVVGFFVTMGILYLTDSFASTKPPNYCVNKEGKEYKCQVFHKLCMQWLKI